ncbi:MAG: PEGA domain-containing protein [Methanospirillum sp.]
MEERERSAENTGAVCVVTEPPGASVALDGRDAGAAPLRIDGLAPGWHGLVLALAGFEEVTTPVEVVAGATTTVRSRLEPTGGTLAVRTEPPGASLWVDGAYAGTTPVVVPLDRAGTVALEAVGPDGVRHRLVHAVAPGADDALVIDLAETERVERGPGGTVIRDFGVFALLAMLIAVLAGVLFALVGSGSRPR